MVVDGADYPWFSASCHLSGTEDKLIMADYLHDFTFSYREFFYEQERSGDMEAIRDAAQQGKTWRRAAFLEKLGTKFNQMVVSRKRGRPKKADKQVCPLFGSRRLDFMSFIWLRTSEQR